MRDFIHRAIWARLPRELRRTALFALTAATAGKPDPDARSAEPIIVVGCLRSATGIGQTARLSYEALKAEGAVVYGIDVSSILMQPRDLADFAYRDGRSLYGPGTLLIHVNAPLIPLVLSSIGRRILRSKRIIGYWAWELPAIPSDWSFGIPFVHEVWTPSRFVADAVGAAKVSVPIHVVPPAASVGVNAALRREASGRPFTALTVFDMGSSMARKNPIGAIEAFRKAFGQSSGARMIVKTRNTDQYSEGKRQLHAAVNGAANIRVIEHTMRRSELLQLYGDCDCLISLHRSEGFGLALAESMLSGIPVLATDWSGTTDFINSTTGYPVPYRLIPARDPQRTYEVPSSYWANPDVTAAADILEKIRGDRTGVSEVAREFASKHFSAKAYATCVQRFLFGSSSGFRDDRCV